MREMKHGELRSGRSGKRFPKGRHPEALAATRRIRPSQNAFARLQFQHVHGCRLLLKSNRLQEHE